MPATKLAEVYNIPLLLAGWSKRTDRFWPRSALRNITAQFKPGLGDFIASGSLPDLRINLAEASHRTNRVYLKNDSCELWAEIQLLDTPCGRLLRQGIKSDTATFDCIVMGIVNDYSEIEPDSVQYLRITAYGGYK